MIQMEGIRTLQIETPVGEVHITATGDAIVALQFGRRAPDGKPAAGTAPAEDEKRSAGGEVTPDAKADRLLLRAAAELDEYFAGRRRDFTLPLAPRGTVFQQAVWKALRSIPYGQTRTYGEIARQIGHPRACRAVGMANHRNPIAIVIPCHRVIGNDGSLTGYAAGVGIKAQLLALERRYSAAPDSETERSDAASPDPALPAGTAFSDDTTVPAGAAAASGPAGASHS